MSEVPGEREGTQEINTRGVAPLRAADAAPDGDHPRNDPIGTVREIQNHVYVKLAEPAGEPWHIAWCHGEQFMSGWQSNDCMAGSARWEGYLPVRECGVEGKNFVSWERWLEAKRELDRVRAQAQRYERRISAFMVQEELRLRADAANAALSEAGQEDE